jgi:hypothetical protein
MINYIHIVVVGERSEIQQIRNEITNKRKKAPFKFFKEIEGKSSEMQGAFER